MLLFNEIMYDNATDGAEYIELYNPTEQTIVLPQLFLYKMHEDGKVYSTTTLQNESPSQPLIIASKGYLCFSKYLDKIIQKHNVNRENLIEISKFPALDNEGGYLALSSTPKLGKDIHLTLVVSGTECTIPTNPKLSAFHSKRNHQNYLHSTRIGVPLNIRPAELLE